MSGTPIWVQLRRRLLTAVAVLAVGAGLVADRTGALRSAELELRDAVLTLRTDDRPPPSITVVAIDTDTLTELGRFPFSRRYHARVLDRLREAGAAVVVFDVQFTEPAADPAEDDALIAAASRRPGTIFATTETGPGGATNVFGGADGLRAARAVAGHASFPVDEDGAVRRVPVRTAGLPTLAARAVSAAGRRLPRGRPVVPIDFAGRPGTVTSVPFADVLRGRAPAARLRGSTVLIGATAPGLKDALPTAAGSTAMPGVEVHANAIHTLTAGAPLRPAAPVWTVLLTLLTGALAPAVALRTGARGGVLVGVGAIAGALLLAAGLVTAGVQLDVLGPVVAGLVAVVGVVFAVTTATSARIAATERTFGRFVPRSVARQLLGHGGPGDGVPATTAVGTVLVYDLQDSVRFCRDRDPHEALAIIDAYLRVAGQAVLDAGGTPISYRGDGLVAVFGTPEPLPQHARAGVAAARSALARSRALGDEHARAALPVLAARVVVHSGVIWSGTVGADDRAEFMVAGDAVNLAFRLEGHAAGIGAELLVSAETAADVVDLDDLRPAPPATIRGFAAPVEVYAR